MHFFFIPGGIFNETPKIEPVFIIINRARKRCLGARKVCNIFLS